MKHIIKVTETFDKLIVVEADTEEEALNKCWDAVPVFFDYLEDESSLCFEIDNDAEDKADVLKYEEFYQHLN